MNASQLEKNKAVIAYFDKACIEQHNEQVLDELVADHVINHATPPGRPDGKESFYHFLTHLHEGLSDIRVSILRQIAEDDLVVTHKVITGTHTGHLFGIPATDKAISIEAIEIIRLEDGRYAEHWVQSDMSAVMASLSSH